MGALSKRRRSDAGFQRSFTPRIAETLRRQYAAHPGWTVQLHYDNLVVVAGANPAFGPLPSYPSVLRLMRTEGLRRTRPGRRMLAGEAAALGAGDPRLRGRAGAWPVACLMLRRGDLVAPGKGVWQASAT